MNQVRVSLVGGIDSFSWVRKRLQGGLGKSWEQQVTNWCN